MLLRQVGAKLRALKLFKFRIHEHGKKISQLGHGCGNTSDLYITEIYSLRHIFRDTKTEKKLFCCQNKE